MTPEEYREAVEAARRALNELIDSCPTCKGSGDVFEDGEPAPPWPFSCHFNEPTLPCPTCRSVHTLNISQISHSFSIHEHRHGVG